MGWQGRGEGDAVRNGWNGRVAVTGALHWLLLMVLTRAEIGLNCFF